MPQFPSVSTALKLHEERHGINLLRPHQTCTPLLCAGKGAPGSEQIISSAARLWEDGALHLLPAAVPPGSLCAPGHLYAQLGVGCAGIV